ncbi:MAG: pirin family protein [Bacteroidota bacterium]|nr:pirin family protein [Bacteroidota bacterium]MDP3145241.1 pirin family protein [Bacteroidota bacterium]MDP3556928.1 pirin family protein [Bacteroidota bacterium]
MSNYRKIQSIHIAPETMMGPIKLRQAFPLQGMQQVSPFILLHHFDFTYKPNENNFNVPPHPHRGFSPITFMYNGSIEHEDSLGNKKVIGDNEVQWINAGRGIVHSEKADKEFIKKGGRSQGIQLWINTPKANKMDPPSYQPITKKEIVLIEKEGVELRLVSGKFLDKKGPAKSEVFTAMLRMKEGSNYSFSFPKTNNVAFYVLEGDLKVNENIVAKQHSLIAFENEEAEIKLTASADAILLLMAGEPINEPLVTHGPFVMTSETEIMEAMRDYQQGKMGFLS